MYDVGLGQHVLVKLLDLLIAVLSWRPRDELLQALWKWRYAVSDRMTPPVGRYERVSRDRYARRR